MDDREKQILNKYAVWQRFVGEGEEESQILASNCSVCSGCSAPGCGGCGSCGGCSGT